MKGPASAGSGPHTSRAARGGNVPVASAALVFVVLAALALGYAVGTKRHEARAIGALETERKRAEALAVELRSAEVAKADLQLRLEEANGRAARELDRRVEREQSFLGFQRGVASLAPGGMLGTGSAFDEALRAALGLEPPEGSAGALAEEAVAKRDEEERAERERAFLEEAAARARRFNALLRVHGVLGLDLVEAGLARERGWGPVVFRTLDGDGRLAGSLSAELLHLSGSRTGRTLTLSLVAGSEFSGGEARPFSNGERRIALRHVDPVPFAEAFPELFDDGQLQSPVDDGRWSLPLVRLRLNELLAEAGVGDRHRVSFLGGVLGEELRDLALEVHDETGRVQRLLFADRARLSLEGNLALLDLFDGSSSRGDVQAPFLDGRLRIALPRVDGRRWRDAGLPGLSPAPGDS